MSSSGFFNLFLRLQLPQEKQLRGSADLSMVNSSRKMQENAGKCNDYVRGSSGSSLTGRSVMEQAAYGSGHNTKPVRVQGTSK